MRKFFNKIADGVGDFFGTILGTIDAFRAQRHLNMAALTPFIHERIAHYEQARIRMRKAGLPEDWIDSMINFQKNEAA